MPLIQSSALRVRGTRVDDEGVESSGFDSAVFFSPSPKPFSGSETATTVEESEASVDSTAGVSCDAICSFMSAPPELVHASGGIPAQSLLPVAQLFSSLSPRQWPRKVVPASLAQGYELA